MRRKSKSFSRVKTGVILVVIVERQRVLQGGAASPAAALEVWLPTVFRRKTETGTASKLQAAPSDDHTSSNL